MTRGTNNAGDKGTSGQNVPKSPKGPKTQKSKFRMESEQEKISKSKLRMETREDKLNRARKKLEGKKPPKPRGPVRRVLGAAGWNVHGFVHGKVYEVEHENVGTEGAHRSELVGEAVGRAAVHTVKKRIREHPARAVHKAEAQYIKARADYQFRMAAQENPELAKNAVTRYWHKQKLKKQYAKQARQAAKQTAKQGAKAAGKTAAATEKLAERAVAFVKRHPVGALIALACVVLVLSLQSCASSLVSLGNAAAGAVGATTYPAEDGDMLGAEAAYCSLEAELQHYLDTYESTHDYDEYHFDRLGRFLLVVGVRVDVDAVGCPIVGHAEVHRLPDVPHLDEIVTMDAVRLELHLLPVDIEGLAAGDGLQVVRCRRRGAAQGEARQNADPDHNRFPFSAHRLSSLPKFGYSAGITIP